MASKKFWYGILVITLVFGMTIVGCVKRDNGGIGADNVRRVLSGNIDRSINGTWESENGVYIFRNGEYELSMDNSPFYKGTYTTNDGVITLKTTHVYGIFAYLESKWYTVTEFLTTMNGLGSTIYDTSWIVTTYDYSVSGNTLTFAEEEIEIPPHTLIVGSPPEREVIIFTKK
jgi:hypothetical protein